MEIIIIVGFKSWPERIVVRFTFFCCYRCIRFQAITTSYPFLACPLVLKCCMFIQLLGFVARGRFRAFVTTVFHMTWLRSYQNIKPPQHEEVECCRRQHICYCNYADHYIAWWLDIYSPAHWCYYGVNFSLKKVRHFKWSHSQC